MDVPSSAAEEDREEPASLSDDEGPHGFYFEVKESAGLDLEVL